MGCMAMDVAHILEKGRHEFKALTVTFEGERAQEPPRRYTAIHLTFQVTTNAGQDVVERAIELSHTKYCSVSNTLRPDLDFKTTVIITRVNRRPYIDWLRGLAVVVMMEWHSIDSWSVTAGRDSEAFGWSAWIGGWAAPSFLYLAGVAVSLAGIARMRRGLDRHAASWTLQKRGWRSSPLRMCSGSSPISSLRAPRGRQSSSRTSSISSVLEWSPRRGAGAVRRRDARRPCGCSCLPPSSCCSRHTRDCGGGRRCCM